VAGTSPASAKVLSIPCNFSGLNGAKPAGSESADIFRQRLEELDKLKHPLAQLAYQLHCFALNLNVVHVPGNTSDSDIIPIESVHYAGEGQGNLYNG